MNPDVEHREKPGVSVVVQLSLRRYEALLTIPASHASEILEAVAEMPGHGLVREGSHVVVEHVDRC